MAPKPITFCESFTAAIKRTYTFFSSKIKVNVSDAGFRISAKYSSYCCSILFCISMSNELFLVDELKCTGGENDVINNALTEHCWLHGPFLVKRLLQPNMSGDSIYPGVGSYRDGVDELVTMNYYNIVWIISGVAASLFSAPLILWQIRGSGRILDLTDILTPLTTEERTVRFLNTRKMDCCFGMEYMLFKLISTTSHLLVLFFFCVMLGDEYAQYGWNVLVRQYDGRYTNPRHSLFPKTAKCFKKNYGRNQDVESVSGICDLPMNYLSQWTFLLFWWWNLFAFAVNFISTCKLIFMWISPCIRNRDFKFRRLYTYKDDGNGHPVIHLTHEYITGKTKKVYSLAFSEWLILTFVKQNIDSHKFAEFLCAFLIVKNQEETQAMELETVSKTDEGENTSNSDWGET